VSAPSVYDRMCWPEGQLELALAGGEHRRELAAFLGEGDYMLLSTLARQAASARPKADAPVIYLLPGILGSQLGVPRAPGEPPDVLWLDPDDVVNGRLTELHPQQSSALRPLGPVIYNYLTLKLRLAAAGYRVVFHDYDWRNDILASGRRLAERLKTDPAVHIALVGHSMGGLLARAALRHIDSECGPERVRHIVGIGAPHGGAIAAVQALRATYPVVCRLAAIDRRNDAQSLTRNVFRYFLSLYQMLPAQSPALNLFDADSWPSVGAVPVAELLASASSFGSQLAPADARFSSIVGTGQRTVTGVTRQDEEFRYEITSAGDGTVAISRASLAGAQLYSVRCEHSELPRSSTVADAVIDLVRSGRTRRLSSGVTEQPGHRIYLTDAMISRELSDKLDWHKLSIQQRRRYLDRISAAPASYRFGQRRPATHQPVKKL
jgi:pimeloyl-ACP methyl ester carboxylesterase